MKNWKENIKEQKMLKKKVDKWLRLKGREEEI